MKIFITFIICAVGFFVYKVITAPRVDHEAIKITGAVAELIMVHRQAGEPRERVLAFINDTTADCNEAMHVTSEMLDEAFAMPIAETDDDQRRVVENFKSKWTLWAANCELQRIKKV